MGELLLATAAFVGTHELLSHPLRRPLVGALGDRGFLGLYSVVSLATLIWAVNAYRHAPDQILWTAPAALHLIGSFLMLVASVLFAGSLLSPNPAMTGMGGALAREPLPQGVLRITRHPMMWSFALWAIVHVVSSGSLAALILYGGIGFLALFGAAMQDRKKAVQIGDAWGAWTRATSFVPFARGGAWPGWRAGIAGAILFLGATWAHPALFGAPIVGVWNWL